MAQTPLWGTSIPCESWFSSQFSRDFQESGQGSPRRKLLRARRSRIYEKDQHIICLSKSGEVARSPYRSRGKGLNICVALVLGVPDGVGFRKSVANPRITSCAIDCYECFLLSFVNFMVSNVRGTKEKYQCVAWCSAYFTNTLLAKALGGSRVDFHINIESFLNL
jgi:hypothetical protein